MFMVKDMLHKYAHFILKKHTTRNKQRNLKVLEFKNNFIGICFQILEVIEHTFNDDFDLFLFLYKSIGLINLKHNSSYLSMIHTDNKCLESNFPMNFIFHFYSILSFFNFNIE